jgi:acetolactate synthase-1/3 small subunit
VVVDVEELPLEQVTKQLNKLVNVIKIVELDPAQTVQREHLLIKVRVDNTTRSQILEATTLFRARIVDVATDALVIEVTGDTAKTQALLRVLEPYGIKEIAQSGLLAIGRGSKSITERIFKTNQPGPELVEGAVHQTDGPSTSSGTKQQGAHK